MRWIKRLLQLTLLLLVLAAVAAWVYSRRVLPQTEGRVELPGLQAELRIERDADGIPTIRAANAHDLMFGLGVVHVQDRLWQMETHRRIGAGQLAEAFGKNALANDRFLRALGVRRAAQAQWAQTRGEGREALLAYTAGVNAAIRQLVQARPPEFVVLGLPLPEWTPVDTIAWQIMMAWDLGGNWTTELLRLRLALKFDKARIDQLVPPYPGEAPLPTQDYPQLYRGLKLGTEVALGDAALNRLLASAPESGLEGVGSNNWVLAGSRTTTGAPLLANDPHLKLSAPALWYFARLEAPGLRVAGATMPGVPGVVLGQNEQLAWGFTNTGPDVQDLYLERLKPGDPSQYETPGGGWSHFETWQETIRVRGEADVAMTVRQSRHGPVISDAGATDDVVGSGERQAHVLALRWAALEPDSDQTAAGLRMSRARTVAEFMEATRGWLAPMQSMVVADKTGAIGLVAPGRVPKRRADNDLLGQAPAPGWEARYDWDGWLPWEVLPRWTEAPQGYFATANQRIVPADYPHYLTNGWAAPYRQQRIEQLLAAKPKHSLDDLRAIQADEVSLAVDKLLPHLLAVNTNHPLATAAKRQLEGFDGRMAADRAAPLIYWAWSRQLTRRVLGDDLALIQERGVVGRSFVDALEGILARNDSGWCDDRRTPAAETCAQQAAAAFDATLDELKALQGDDPAAWRWGRAHQARSEHRPFSNVKALARFFELRTPVGGDTYTVNVSRVNLRPDPTTGELYLDEHGPSLRALYDVADPSKSRFMHSTGQSGVPWSPLYRSFVGRWAAVQGVPVWAQGAPQAVLTIGKAP